MNSVGDGGFSQGRSTNRPPLFCGNNFAHWRSLMQMFIIDQDMELWDIIKRGPKVPMKTTESGASVPKSESEYTQTDLESISKNYRAMNVLYCSLDANEFNRISSCKSAKEIWDKLVVTYEGTSQVKETKISIFIRQYELFKMTKDESIKEMFTRFTEIVNNLDSLGKVFSNEEKVRKILRCLPKGKWGPKVTAIEEAQDLRHLPLDNLLGKLITHEMSLNEDDGDLPSTSKNLVLKAKKEERDEDTSENEEDDDDDDEDPFALITRGLARILKMKKSFNKDKSFSRGSRIKGKGTGKFHKSKLTCYECGETDHFVRDCPKKKKERFKDRKKKAMVAAWSDSDSSSDEEEDEKQANLCLIADHDSSSDSKNALEVTVKNIVSSPPELLFEIIQNMILTEEKLENHLLLQRNISNNKSRELEELKVSHSALESKFKASQSDLESNFKASQQDLETNFKASQSALESKFKALETKVKTLESENQSLKQKLSNQRFQNDELLKEKRLLTEKCREQKNSLVRFTNSEATLNKMLGVNQSSLNKTGLGFNQNFPKKTRTTFVKERKTWFKPTCFYCCKKGHTKLTCPYRRNDPYIIKNTFPTFLKQKIKQVWVVKGTRPPNMVYPNF